MVFLIYTLNKQLSLTYVYLSEHNILLPFKKKKNTTEKICNIFIFIACFPFHCFAIKRGQNHSFFLFHFATLHVI